MPADVLGREIEVGDYVMYNASIYRVNALKGEAKVAMNYAAGSYRLVRDKVKKSEECIIVPEADILVWLLSKEK